MNMFAIKMLDCVSGRFTLRVCVDNKTVREKTHRTENCSSNKKIYETTDVDWRLKCEECANLYVLSDNEAKKMQKIPPHTLLYSVHQIRKIESVIQRMLHMNLNEIIFVIFIFFFLGHIEIRNFKHKTE